ALFDFGSERRFDRSDPERRGCVEMGGVGSKDAFATGNACFEHVRVVERGPHSLGRGGDGIAAGKIHLILCSRDKEWNGSKGLGGFRCGACELEPQHLSITSKFVTIVLTLTLYLPT